MPPTLSALKTIRCSNSTMEHYKLLQHATLTVIPKTSGAISGPRGSDRTEIARFCEDEEPRRRNGGTSQVALELSLYCVKA